VLETENNMPVRESMVMSTEGPTQASAFVTVSIDDGHPSDLATAELLYKFGLKGTFYIPKTNPERRLMTPPEITEIAKAFEVGGHTLHHVALTKVTGETAWHEINGCKVWLEDVVGTPPVSFCYPRGKYDSTIRRLVAKAGFRGARTCDFNLSGLPSDPFQVGVSTHAFSHSVALQIRHAILHNNLGGAVNYFRVHRMATDWPTHFGMALDWVEQNGGVAHLYMHSWEIEERSEWHKLTGALRDAARRTRITAITNGDLFNLVHARKRPN
jgi:peptidoglycan/xylan/chitin deacetylase (PgdA/CDA1 family)